MPKELDELTRSDSPKNFIGLSDCFGLPKGLLVRVESPDGSCVLVWLGGHLALLDGGTERRPDDALVLSMSDSEVVTSIQ